MPELYATFVMWVYVDESTGTTYYRYELKIRRTGRQYNMQIAVSAMVKDRMRGVVNGRQAYQQHMEKFDRRAMAELLAAVRSDDANRGWPWAT